MASSGFIPTDPRLSVLGGVVALFPPEAEATEEISPPIQPQPALVQFEFEEVPVCQGLWLGHPVLPLASPHCPGSQRCSLVSLKQELEICADLWGWELFREGL